MTQMWNNIEVVFAVVLILLARLVLSPTSSFQHVTDECDWTDSGLSAHGSFDRSIRPIYLRCSQGRIEWKYPRGALRVVLRLGTSGKDFRGCVKAGRRFRGVRLYLEGNRTLHPLYTAFDRRHPQLPRCFTSHHGQVAIYVEAEKQLNGGALGAIEFDYNLQPKFTATLLVQDDTGDNLISDVQTDCSPCDDEHLIQLYCTSDFAARGRMIALHDNEQLERTELQVEATRVYKQTTAVFVPQEQRTPPPRVKRRRPCRRSVGHHEHPLHHRPCDHPFHHHHQHHLEMAATEGVADGTATHISTHSKGRPTPRAMPPTWRGVVHFPRRCGVKFGSGEFLFLGRVSLDSPMVVCAPRWEEWNRMRTKAASKGTLSCTMPTS